MSSARPILSGLVAGQALAAALAGPLQPWSDQVLPVTSLIGTLFLNALKMVALPLIVTTLIASLGGLRQPPGRLGGIALACYLANTTLAIAAVPLAPQADRGASAGRLSVALLQGNIPQDEKFQAGSGIPLALELAAARLRSMTVADINRRLKNRFKLLTGGSRQLIVAVVTNDRAYGSAIFATR